MRTFEQKPKAAQKNKSGASTISRGTTFSRDHRADSSVSLQRAIGNQAESTSSESTVIPPVVNAVLTSAGQPLNAATRSFMEPRFGHDFSNVRVHTDAKAAESARDLNADAYTVGPNIVFGAGNFRPETFAGRQLLSHELTHVVQQRHFPVERGISNPGDFHERQAGAVAETLARGGNIAGLINSGPLHTAASVQRQPQGTSSAVQPLKYDRTGYTIPAVRPGLTAADVRKDLNDKVRQGKITSFSVTGVTGNNEIFLLAILYSMSEKSRWGTETDLVTAIDWATKGGTAPQGRVTVRIDWRGAATAELIARGPVPAVAQQTTAADLKTKYSFSDVKDDGTARWNPDELNDVGAALDMLPSADKTTLADVILLRTDTITIDGKPAAGSFDFPHPMAGSPADINRHATLSLATSAFSHDDRQFFGNATKSVPSSFQAILHEVGHAVESEVYRTRWRDHAQALADTHTAGQIPESDACQKKRKSVEEKKKATNNQAEKDKLDQSMGRCDLELASKQEKAVDKKAAETKLKDKEAEVDALDKSATSHRLDLFVDLITKNHIDWITEYSQKSHAEFYAEAYSLWLVDPEFMRTNYKVIYDFFQNGDYLK